MPYRRKYRKRTFRRRKPLPWYRKRYSVGQIASKALTTAKYVKSLINVEKKMCNTVANTAGSTTPFITSLHDIAQGDTINDRSGNSVKAVSLSCKMTLLNNGTATSGSLFRFVIVKDTQQIGDASPGWTDVFESAAVNSFLNSATLGRFSILYDRVFALNNDSNTERMCVQKYFKMQHHIRYNGTASTDIQKGGLYVMYLSTEPTSTVSVDANFRLRYVDN